MEAVCPDFSGLDEQLARREVPRLDDQVDVIMKLSGLSVAHHERRQVNLVV